LEVTSCGKTYAMTTMVYDGVINQNRGLTIQGSGFKPRCLTNKDKLDLAHIASQSVYDAVALSFVSSKEDGLEARKYMNSVGNTVPIVSKIETQAGIENIDKISSVSDYVMAARGDLALAMSWWDLPEAVQLISDSAFKASVPWLLATQVAEGLERFGMPTRAEICDLAHWMNQGCGGALLSYETVFGSNPLAAISSTEKLVKRWGKNN